MQSALRSTRSPHCTCPQVSDVREGSPRPYVVVFALCDIPAGAELLVDYGTNYFAHMLANTLDDNKVRLGACCRVHGLRYRHSACEFTCLMSTEWVLRMLHHVVLH